MPRTLDKNHVSLLSLWQTFGITVAVLAVLICQNSWRCTPCVIHYSRLLAKHNLYLQHPTIVLDG